MTKSKLFSGVLYNWTSAYPPSIITLPFSPPMPSVPVLLYHHGNDTSIAIFYRRAIVCLILCNTFSQILRNFLWDSLYLYYTEIQKVKEPAPDHTADDHSSDRKETGPPDSQILSTLHMAILKSWQFSEWAMYLMPYHHLCHCSGLSLMAGWLLPIP